MSYIETCPTCGSVNQETNVIKIKGQEITCNCKDQIRKQNHYTRFRIPREYWYIGWDDYKGDPMALKKVKEIVIDLDNAIQRNIGMFLYGSVGTGKTFLAIQILKAAEAKGYYNCMFICLSDIVSTFAGGWYDKAKQYSFEKEIMGADLLVIDDLGKEFKNNLAESVFDKVIRYREKPTIITSNVDLKKIKLVYGDSIYSLFCSRLIPLDIVGYDFRQNVVSNNLQNLLKEKLIYRPIK